MLYWSHIENTNELRTSAAAISIKRVDPAPSETMDELHQDIIQYPLPQLPEECDGDRESFRRSSRARTRRRKLRKYRAPPSSMYTEWTRWNTKRVIEWLSSIEGGKFQDDLYDQFKEQIENIGLKGYELISLNETALKFAGLLNGDDRKVVIRNVLALVNGDGVDHRGLPIKIDSVDRVAPVATDGFEITGMDMEIDPMLNSEGTSSLVRRVMSAEETQDRILNEVMSLWKGSSTAQ